MPLKTSFDKAKANTLVRDILHKPTPEEKVLVSALIAKGGTVESLGEQVSHGLEAGVFDTADKGREEVRRVLAERLARMAAPPPRPNVEAPQSLEPVYGPSLSNGNGRVSEIHRPQFHTVSSGSALQFSQSTTTHKRVVRLLFAAIDDGDRNNLVIRGRIDPETLDHLKIAKYQRGVLTSEKKKKDMIEGFKTGSKFPELDFGARGNEVCHIVSDQRGLVLEILPETYVIDGLQRLSAAKEFKKMGRTPTLGAAVVMNSIEAEEKKRFRVLNANRTSVAPSILLRNYIDDSEAMMLLFQLSHQKDFPLEGRVCWEQNRSSDHLINAAGYLKSLCWLHSRIDGSDVRGGTDVVAGILDNLYNKLGAEGLRMNAESFYGFFERTWGVRNLETNQHPVHVLGGFQASMAKMFGEGDAFWKGKELNIGDNVVEKFKSYPVDDPFVREASHGAKPNPQLMEHMLAHLSQ